MSLPLILLLLGDLPETEFSRSSRSFFDRVLELRIHGEVLVVEQVPGTWEMAYLRGAIQSAFPNVGSISISSARGGSSSRHGGGSGEVSIQIGQDGDGSLSVRLQSPVGDESLQLVQGQPGHLRFELSRAKLSLTYEQTPGKCKLSVKAGSESFRASGASVTALLQREPLGVRKYLLGSLERFLDKVPFIAFAAAPPGKTVIRLRDGCEVFGELDADEVVLETAYGRLRIPRKDLVQVFLPGSELEMSLGPEDAPERRRASSDTVIVTRRFSPRGRLEMERFGLRTPYGRLEFEAEDVVYIAFGEDVDARGADARAPGPGDER